MRSKNLIFVPVYNNEKQIKIVLEDLRSLDKSNIDAILIIDNNSNDETLHVIKKEINNLDIKVELIENPKNIGLGGSFKVAINYAIKENFNYMFHYHGNNMNSINDLIKILKESKFKDYDFYFGSRFEKDSETLNYSFLKKFGNLIFNRLYSFVLKKKISDLGGSINVFKVSNFKDKLFENFSNDLTFQYYILLYAFTLNKKISFFPIRVKINHKSNVVPTKHIISLIKILINYIIKKKKMFEIK
jgi:glycosyltransferase involved in cell wall biosynthesis